MEVAGRRPPGSGSFSFSGEREGTSVQWGISRNRVRVQMNDTKYGTALLDDSSGVQVKFNLHRSLILLYIGSTTCVIFLYGVSPVGERSSLPVPRVFRGVDGDMAMASKLCPTCLNTFAYHRR